MSILFLEIFQPGIREGTLSQIRKCPKYAMYQLPISSCIFVTSLSGLLPSTLGAHAFGPYFPFLVFRFSRWDKIVASDWPEFQMIIFIDKFIIIIILKIFEHMLIQDFLAQLTKYCMYVCMYVCNIYFPHFLNYGSIDIWKNYMCIDPILL